MSQSGSRVVASIYCMRTWGEIGNLLAARSLARSIQAADPGFHARVFETESFFPILEETGRRIRQASRDANGSADRRERYLAIMQELEQHFPAGFEGAVQQWKTGDIADLRAHIKQEQPHVVIGTKGIISRLCYAACARLTAPPLIVNFVTNQGLIEFPIHRSKHVPLHLVQFAEAREALIARYGYAPEQVEVVGPLVAGDEIKDFISSSSQMGDCREWLGVDRACRPIAIIFCNRGGADYLRIIQHLAVFHPSVPVLFIAYNDRDLFESAKELKERYLLSKWILMERMAQQAYLNVVMELSKLPYVFMISKAGPNTVMEALFYNLPVLALASGLPMEDWVRALVESRGVGWQADNVEGLLTVMDGLFRDPESIVARKAAVAEFRGQYLDNTKTSRNTIQALRRSLAQIERERQGSSSDHSKELSAGQAG